MPSLYFSDLVLISAGELSQIPATHEVEPDALAELIAQSGLQTSTSNVSVPSLVLDEIAIDLPVHFHLSPRQSNSSPTARLLTTLPSPLVPNSTSALSHFRVTLKLNPQD